MCTPDIFTVQSGSLISSKDPELSKTYIIILLLSFNFGRFKQKISRLPCVSVQATPIAQPWTDSSLILTGKESFSSQFRVVRPVYILSGNFIHVYNIH